MEAKKQRKFQLKNDIREVKQRLEHIYILQQKNQNVLEFLGEKNSLLIRLNALNRRLSNIGNGIPELGQEIPQVNIPK